MNIAGRVPPNDLDAEAAVLEAVMVRGALHQVAEIVAVPDFYSDANGTIFEAALALAQASKPTDQIAIAAWLRERSRLNAIGGPSYLGLICNETPSVYHVEECARTVANRARVRRMIALGHRFVAEGYGDIGDTQEWLDGVEREAFEIAQRKTTTEAEHVKAVIARAVTKVQLAAERGDKITGMPTGLIELDKALGGLQRGDLTILAARPAMGKTALAMGIGLAVAESSVWDGPEKRLQGTALFSLEMPREQLGTRMLYAEAGINSAKLRHKPLTPDDWSNMTQSAVAISRLPFWVDDAVGLTPMGLRSRIRKVRANLARDGVQLGLVVVDYLQLMSGRDIVGKGASRENEVTAISKSLKEIAKEHGVHMLVLSQLNRAVESRSDKRPMLSDLRESGSIEQDADNVIFIYRDEYYYPDKAESKGKAELVIAKQRNGPSPLTALVAFRADCVRFDNLVGYAPTGSDAWRDQ